MSKGLLMKTKAIFAFIILLFSYHSTARTFAPTNVFSPSDRTMKLPYIKNKNFSFGASVEAARTSRGRNWHGEKSNILAIHDPDQEIVAGLRSPSNKRAKELLEKYFGSGFELVDGLKKDSPVGDVAFFGKYQEMSINLFSSYNIPFGNKRMGSFSVDVFLPLKSKKIDNLQFENLAPVYPAVGGSSIGDIIEIAGTNRKKLDELIKNLQPFMKKVANLDLCPTKNSGFGDLEIDLSWCKVFRTGKDVDRKDPKFINILPSLKFGFSIPSGKQKNEDSAFGMALGNDGAWSLIFGGGMELEVIDGIKVGVSTDYTYLFDKTKLRRLKTNPVAEEHQTDFLLLSKGLAKKEHGATIQACPFIQFFRLDENISLKFAYQYAEHKKDKLLTSAYLTEKDPAPSRALVRSPFQNEEINKGNTLNGWFVHNLIVQFNWDLATNARKVGGAPQVSLFYKKGIDGRSIIDSDTFGGQIGFTF
jgi:hypothetical protein